MQGERVNSTMEGVPGSVWYQTTERRLKWPKCPRDPKAT